MEPLPAPSRAQVPTGQPASPVMDVVSRPRAMSSGPISRPVIAGPVARTAPQSVGATAHPSSSAMPAISQPPRPTSDIPESDLRNISMTDTKVAKKEPVAIKPAPKSKQPGQLPIKALLSAFVVMALLAGVAVFGFMKMQQGAGVANTPTAPKATPSDVDQTLQAVDSSLTEVDDAKDFTDEDLSDAALGLE